MTKSLALILGLCAGLAGIAVGISATKAWHILPVKAAARTRSIEDEKQKSSAPAQSSDEDNVIRFASNPQPVPPFSVNDLDGKPVSTAAWKGKVVILNFWATWCPPCRDEIPMLEDLATRYKDRLQVVGISLDDAPPEEVKQFAQEEGINYPIIMGSQKVLDEFGSIPVLPTTFMLDREGRVVQKHAGLYEQEVYEMEVRALMGLPINGKVETFVDIGQIFLKNATLATDLPDVDLAGLTPEQKKAALKKLNSEKCDCMCKLTVAQCRIVDTPCLNSKKMAAKVVKEISSSTP